LTEIAAIDIFIESDPAGEGNEDLSFISVRVPFNREFARQIKELGAKWDDQAKEWQLYGNEAFVKQLANLCKSAFPGLPRRRNRLVAARLSANQGNFWKDGDKTHQVELIILVQFFVNRTFKTYRLGQSLKWSKEFKQIIELLPPPSQDTTVQQNKFAAEIGLRLPDLERVATSAFEALLVGRKEAVKAILNEAGIEQI
jgi:hypothetical protein